MMRKTKIAMFQSLVILLLFVASIIVITPTSRASESLCSAKTQPFAWSDDIMLSSI